MSGLNWLDEYPTSVPVTAEDDGGDEWRGAEDMYPEEGYPISVPLRTDSEEALGAC